jgi:hypothetical protein
MSAHAGDAHEAVLQNHSDREVTINYHFVAQYLPQLRRVGVRCLADPRGMKSCVTTLDHCLSKNVSGILPRWRELHENSSHWCHVRNLDRVRLPKASAGHARSRDNKIEVHDGSEDVEIIICATR